MTLKNPYQKAQFLKSAAKLRDLPEDTGYEVAFAGRSNAGKSTALNCLTQNKHLAKTSKTPGRTQLINLFEFDPQRRLVDLPGYGYAKVSQATKENWQKSLSEYLKARKCLKGLILVSDIRHPLKELDTLMADWAISNELPVHFLLTKADKLNKSQVKETCKKVERFYAHYISLISVQSFSATKNEGLELLINQLNRWYAL